MPLFSILYLKLDYVKSTVSYLIFLQFPCNEAKYGQLCISLNDRTNIFDLCKAGGNYANL